MTAPGARSASGRRTAIRAERHDVIVVGGGLAGLSAALWFRDFGLDAVVVEGALQPGGQLHQIHARIPNYPLAYGWDGARFAGALLSDARAADLAIRVGSPVRALAARTWSAETEDERFRGRALLVATGLRRRRLRVPGEDSLLGRGVSHSANRDRERFAGQRVVVVGGGTAAVEDSILLAEAGCDVTLLHRSTRFRTRRDFLEKARANPRIRILLSAAVRRIEGSDRVEGVRYRRRGLKSERSLACTAVFVRIGWEPRTDLLRGQLRLDRAGYVRVGPSCETSVPGVYAAGDVCSPHCPSLANAAGQGAAAAWAIARRLGRVRG